MHQPAPPDTGIISLYQCNNCLTKCQLHYSSNSGNPSGATTLAAVLNIQQQPLYRQVKARAACRPQRQHTPPMASLSFDAVLAVQKVCVLRLNSPHLKHGLHQQLAGLPASPRCLQTPPADQTGLRSLQRCQKQTLGPWKPAVQHNTSEWL